MGTPWFSSFCSPHYFLTTKINLGDAEELSFKALECTWRMMNFTLFLVACQSRYKRPCLSVGWSIKGCFIAHGCWLPCINILRHFLREHSLELNLLQLSHSMFCKNVACLAVARGCHTWIRSLATAKQATFLQNTRWESCSKFEFKQCSLKESLKMLLF